MAMYSADRHYRKGTRYLQEVGLPDADTSIDGIGICWTITSARGLGAERTYKALAYSALHDQGQQEKPVMIIRCFADASANNAVIVDEDGTELYRFNTDCSATPKYCVLQYGPTDKWVLAGTVAD